VKQWRREHPGEQIPDGHLFTQPWPAGPNGGRRDQVIYYQYKADRARRTLRGTDEQVAKAEKAVAGQVPVKRSRFIWLSGGTRTVDRELEAKARALAGLKGYITSLRACPDGTPVSAEFVIGAYRQLFQIEKSFRMARSDLQAGRAGPPRFAHHAPARTRRSRAAAEPGAEPCAAGSPDRPARRHTARSPVRSSRPGSGRWCPA
jgi:hypothetical protein